MSTARRNMKIGVMTGLSFLFGSFFLTGNHERTDSPSSKQERQLAGAKASPEVLARHFLEVLSRGDRQEILGLALTEEEFREFVYPVLPASRPGSNLSAEFLWSQTQLRSLGGFSKTMKHAGKPYELLEVIVREGKREYEGFSIHRGVSLRVRDETGSVSEWKLFGSIIEMNGGFKIYSFAQ